MSRLTRPATRSSDPSTKGVNAASGPGPAASAKTPGSPRRKLIACVRPSLSTSTSSRADRALTTLAPTPCRPPEAAYEPPPNLPPAWSLVNTTSTPDSPVLGSTSTGMPRPSSRTSTEPSACSVTSIEWQWPPSASSTALSMISQRQCMRPRESVDPMYMPGRLRTASRPSRTDRCRAVYPDAAARRSAWRARSEEAGCTATRRYSCLPPGGRAVVRLIEDTSPRRPPGGGHAGREHTRTEYADSERLRPGGPGTARAASLLPQRRPSTGRAPALHDPEEVSP